jgi:predicted TIM-barrel fold metal-dependent hydrolase
MKIDAHTHVFSEDQASSFPLALRKARSFLRTQFKPLTIGIHKAQPWIRTLPSVARSVLDRISAFAPLPGLLIESTVEDLQESMKANEIDASVVVAFPPLISNEFVLTISEKYKNLIPIVSIPGDVKRGGPVLKKLIERGARGIKIYRTLDELSVSSTHYQSLLEVCAEYELPVILHTGRVQIGHIGLTDEFGDPRTFKPWFEKFPNISFILAHMNYSEPEFAIRLAENYTNLYLDTSWQPLETISEAIRRIGAHRVLFSSDWPIVGQNQQVALKQLQLSKELNFISQEEYDQVVGLNAAKLFKYETTQ